MKSLQSAADTVEVLVVLKRGHVKMKLPALVFGFFQANAQGMKLGEKGMPLSNLLKELEALTAFEPEKIVRSEWWKELRAGLWVIKLND